MARTTAADVKAIIDTSLTDSEVDVFINTANTLVNSRISEDLSDELTEVEKYVAAHLIDMRTTRLKSFKVEGAISESYMVMDGFNFNATPYGQTAVLLDSTESLSKLAMQYKSASISVIDYNEVG